MKTLSASPITRQSCEYAANAVLHWLRDATAAQDMLDWTPREIRDTLLRMMPFEGIEARRAANQATRWIGDQDGYLAVRWQRDIAAMRAILRVIEQAIGTPGAEQEEDLVDDETACSYPRLFSWLQDVHNDMAGLLREQKRLGVRPKRARDILLHHAVGSLSEASVEA